MPTYNRVHLKSCLARAVISAVENLRDDTSISHLTFHRVIDGGTHEGYSLYAAAYEYLELGMVNCTCGAVPSPEESSERKFIDYGEGGAQPTSERPRILPEARR